MLQSQKQMRVVAPTPSVNRRIGDRPSGQTAAVPNGWTQEALGYADAFRFRGPEVKEVIRPRYVADAHPSRVVKPQCTRSLAQLAIERAHRRGQQIGPQAAVPLLPIGDGNGDVGLRRNRSETELVDYRKRKRLGAAAISVAEQQPAVFGQIGEQLAPNGNHVNMLESADEVLDDRPSIRCMPDLRRNHKRHPAARLQQRRCRNQERRPGGCERRERNAQSCAQSEGALTNGPRKALISDERRIAGGAFKSLASFRRPREEVALVNERAGGDLMDDTRCFRIVFDAHAVGMRDQESAVPARRIEKAIGFAPDRPSNQ